MSFENITNFLEETTRFADVTTQFDDLTTKHDDGTTHFDDFTTSDSGIPGNFTTPVSYFRPDFIKLTIYKVNLVLAGILTSFGALNLFFLWCLLKFCPIIKTFNTYAVMICIADLINNLVIGPMYVISWIDTRLLTEHFCKVSPIKLKNCGVTRQVKRPLLRNFHCLATFGIIIVVIITWPKKKC